MLLRFIYFLGDREVLDIFRGWMWLPGDVIAELLIIVIVGEIKY